MKRFSTWICISILLVISTSPSTRAAGSSPSPTQITFNGGRHPTLSPDGTFMAYELSPGLGVMDLTTGNVETIVEEQAMEPDWSRDNRRILYRGGNPYGLWTCPYLPGEYFWSVFVTDDGFDDGAVWGGGHSIVAQTSSGPNGDGLVIIADTNGIASYVSCQESDQTSCSGEDPTVSQDYLWIAFSDGGVQKVPKSGGESVSLTTAAQGGAHPSWSPDGQWIAFVKYEQSAEETNSQIWVTDARGSSFGLVQVTDGSYLDDDPAWSPNSHEIYFTSNRSGSDEIWKVAFDPGLVPAAKQTWGQLKAHRW